MDGTIIQQGRFISDGEAKTIQLRSDVDWMKVYNLSNISGNTQFDGTEFYWQRGFDPNDGILFFHTNNASQIVGQSLASIGVGAGAVGGFTLVDSSIQTPGAAFTITAISTAAVPRVTTAANQTLPTGTVVRLSNTTAALQFSGIEFTIARVDDTHFDLTNAPQLAVAGTGGQYRVIAFPPIFQPQRLFITKISKAAEAIVTTSVAHNLQIGQEVRFNVPFQYGMVQINGLAGTITSVTEFTFGVDIDSTGFTTFAFPTSADVPFTQAEVIPFGENTAEALSVGVDILQDATINQAFIGMILAAGPSSPAGEDTNIIYWVAGKSFNVDN